MCVCVCVCVCVLSYACMHDVHGPQVLMRLGPFTSFEFCRHARPKHSHVFLLWFVGGSMSTAGLEEAASTETPHHTQQ